MAALIAVGALALIGVAVVVVLLFGRSRPNDE
jgi:hypothetical protein